MSRSELLLRTAMGAVIGTLATVMYHGTQYLGMAHAVVRSDCWSWQLVPFHPGWFWPYVSVFVLMGVPWFALRTLEGVRRFAIAFIPMAGTAWLMFLVYPTACARPSALRGPAYFAALHEMDYPNNCLPCLHSALTIFATCALFAEAPAFQRRLPRLLLAAWALAILFSIVGLRQHTGIDTTAGVFLGFAGALIFVRLRRIPDLAPR